MARLKSTLAQKLAHQRAIDRVVTHIEVDRRRRQPRTRQAQAGPTDERLAMAGNGVSNTPGGPIRIVSAIDLYRRELSDEEIWAHNEIQELCLRANAACAAPVSSYEGIRGSSPVPKDGRVHDADRDAFNEYQDVWSQIETPYRLTLLDLVYNSNISVTAHGAKWMTLQDRATQRGGGIVALRAALIRAHSVISACRRRRHNGGPR